MVWCLEGEGRWSRDYFFKQEERTDVGMPMGMI